MTRRAAVLMAAYIGTIVAANWAVSAFDPVPVWPWPYLVAPAGVVFAGLAFTLRDLLHESAGPWWVLAAIGAGTAVSFGVAPPILAVASASAFAVSELLDMGVYARLRNRGRWLSAVLVSNTVGLVADSAVFLWLAFGSLAFLPGQVVGKAWLTILAVCVLAVGRRLVARRAEA